MGSCKLIQKHGHNDLSLRIFATSKKRPAFELVYNEYKMWQIIRRVGAIRSTHTSSQCSCRRDIDALEKRVTQLESGSTIGWDIFILSSVVVGVSLIWDRLHNRRANE